MASVFDRNPNAGFGGAPAPTPNATTRDAGFAGAPAQQRLPTVGGSSAPTAAPTGGPAAPGGAAPNGALGTNPAYLAYLRALGLSQADAQAAAGQAVAGVQARLSNSLSDLSRTNANANLNAGSRLEASGMSNSTTGRFQVAQFDAAEAARQEALRQAAAGQVQSLLTNLALANQRGQVGAANAALTAAPAVDLQAAAAGNYGVGTLSPAAALAAIGATP